MLGSILSNLLLVMGMCFLLGGIVHRGESGHGREQSFASATAQTTCSMMTLSSASLVIPAAVCHCEYPCPRLLLIYYSCTLFLTKAALRTRKRSRAFSPCPAEPPLSFSSSMSCTSSSSFAPTAIFSMPRTKTTTPLTSPKSLFWDLWPQPASWSSRPFLSPSAPTTLLEVSMNWLLAPELARLSLV